MGCPVGSPPGSGVCDHFSNFQQRFAYRRDASSHHQEESYVQSKNRREVRHEHTEQEEKAQEETAIGASAQGS
jgi:hypothetical protein